MSTLPKFGPPRAALAHLGNIASLFASDASQERIPAPYTISEGGNWMWRLIGPDGHGGTQRVFFYCGPHQLDTDGALSGVHHVDSSHQSETALSNHDGSALNPRTIPYFVLPEAAHGHDLLSFLKDDYSMDIKLGDVAIFLRVIPGTNDVKWCAAEFGDTGPYDQLGEASIAVHEALGHTVIDDNGNLINAGIDDPIMVFVFPGSGVSKGPGADAITAAAKARFNALGGKL